MQIVLYAPATIDNTREMARNRCWKCGRRHEAPTGHACTKTPEQSGSGAGQTVKVKGEEKEGLKTNLFDEEGDETTEKTQKEDVEHVEDEEEEEEEEESPKEKEGKGKEGAYGGARPKNTTYKSGEGIQQDEIVAALLARNRELVQEIEGKKKSAKRDESPVLDEIRSIAATMDKFAIKFTQMDDEIQEIKGGRAPREQPAPTGVSTDTSAELTKQVATLLGIDVRTVPGTGYQSEEDKRRGRAIRSGRELRAENEVVREVPWPHHRVYRVLDLKGAPYDGLNQTEFCYGYMMQALEPRNEEIREHMLTHLLTMLEDAKDFPDDWEAIRAYHALVLTYIERGIFGWEDKDQILALRTKYVFAMRQSTVSCNPCPEYNKGKCQFKRDHDDLKHVCAHCFSTTGRRVPHPQTNCFKLNGMPKGTWPAPKQDGAP